MVSALISGSSGPAGDIALCSWARYFTLSVSLYTQLYKCVPANLMLGGNPAIYQHLIQGELIRNTSGPGCSKAD